MSWNMYTIDRNDLNDSNNIVTLNSCERWHCMPTHSGFRKKGRKILSYNHWREISFLTLFSYHYLWTHFRFNLSWMIYYVYDFRYCHDMLYILICYIRILSSISSMMCIKKYNETACVQILPVTVIAAFPVLTMKPLFLPVI
jgi:hypothetical protein